MIQLSKIRAVARIVTTAVGLSFAVAMLFATALLLMLDPAVALAHPGSHDGLSVSAWMVHVVSHADHALPYLLAAAGVIALIVLRARRARR